MLRRNFLKAAISACATPHLLGAQASPPRAVDELEPSPLLRLSQTLVSFVALLYPKEIRITLGLVGDDIVAQVDNPNEHAITIASMTSLRRVGGAEPRQGRGLYDLQAIYTLHGAQSTQTFQLGAVVWLPETPSVSLYDQHIVAASSAHWELVA